MSQRHRVLFRQEGNIFLQDIHPDQFCLVKAGRCNALSLPTAVPAPWVSSLASIPLSAI